MEEECELSLSDFSGCPDGSESLSSATPEEERIRRLFHVCDQDGDGYISRLVFSVITGVPILIAASAISEFFSLPRLTRENHYSNDILNVCRRLALDFSAQEIMMQLGGDAAGRISYDDFVARRRELLDHGAKCLTRSSTADDFWPIDLEQYQDHERDEFFPELVDSKRTRPQPTDEKHLWVSAGSGKGSDSAASHSMAASSSAKHESSLWEFDSGAHDLLLVDDQMSIHRLIESQGVAVPPDCIELLEIANNVSTVS